MLTALKWGCTSVTVGSLVAAITVRVIAEGAGVVCAAAELVSTTALSSSIPVILNRMIASQFKGYLDHRTRSAPRLEQVDDEHSERVKDCKHRPQSCDDSALRCESQAGWNFRKGQALLVLNQPAEKCGGATRTNVGPSGPAVLSSQHHDQRYGFGDPDRICRGHRLQPTQPDIGILLSAWKPMLNAGAFGFSSEPVGEEQSPMGPRAYRGGRPDRVQARL